MRTCVLGAVVAMMLGGGCATSTVEEGAAVRGGEATPWRSVGDRAPDGAVMTAEGVPMRMGDLYGEKPVIVVFYRGGWCPYCNEHLRAWAERMDRVNEAGAVLVAVSPEKPEFGAATGTKAGAPFMMVSDTSLEAARGFGVVFTMDDATREKYLGYGVDLAQRNASGTWELPAPGTFVVDRAGVVRYSSASWDYTQRADPDEVLARVREIR